MNIANFPNLKKYLYMYAYTSLWYMLVYDTCKAVYGGKSQHDLQLTHDKIK